jgi:L-fuculose-phosphate aldolase
MGIVKKYKPERKETASFMRRLYKQGLTSTSGGNISLRISEDLIAITASATDKGRMKWKEVGLITIKGKNLTPELKPSIELAMHLAIYKKNKDVAAIIHAHPICATAFTAMKCKIDTNLIAEARAIIGDPLLVTYALMGTKDLADRVADKTVQSSVLLLENHGVLTTGADLLQAFDKLEVLENTAKITLIVGIMGEKSPLSRSRVIEIEKMFR